jgi:hypothetical protein
LVYAKANQRWTDAIQVNSADGEVTQEVIAFNIAEDHGVARFRRILLELKQHRVALAGRRVEEFIESLLKRRLQPGDNAAVHVVLDTSGHGGDEFLQYRVGRHDNPPGPE